MPMILGWPVAEVFARYPSCPLWYGSAEHFDVLSHHLCCGIAENPLRRGVSRLNRAESLMVIMPSDDVVTT